jgi:acyl carrier protein
MELKDFIEKFAEQFDDVEIANLNADTKFREMDGWSSLVALMVITMIDEEYEITITGDDMKKQNTIGDLFNLVSSRL